MRPTLEYGLRRGLERASGHVLDACTALAGFVEDTGLWVDFEDDGGATVTALADRHRSVQKILTALKTQTTKLAAEQELCALAWQAHYQAVTREPRIHPVTDDDRIARALAVRLSEAQDATAEARLWCTLAELDLEPDGPAWVRWGLTVQHDRLCWAPHVPVGPRPAPAWPAPIADTETAAASAVPGEAAQTRAATDPAPEQGAVQ